MTERQAQLPRTWVERLLNTVQQRGRRSKVDAWLLGVSCSALFGLYLDGQVNPVETYSSGDAFSGFGTT